MKSNFVIVNEATPDKPVEFKLTKDSDGDIILIANDIKLLFISSHFNTLRRFTTTKADQVKLAPLKFAFDRLKLQSGN